jgi:hypothetical protein
MRVLFAISLISILFALVSAQSPTYAPTTRSPTSKPTQRPTRAKYLYTTTDAEATANVAWSAVIGTLGFIGKYLLQCLTYFIFSHDPD